MKDLKLRNFGLYSKFIRLLVELRVGVTLVLLCNITEDCAVENTYVARARSFLCVKSKRKPFHIYIEYITLIYIYIVEFQDHLKNFSTWTQVKY
jgi:hypothetical protein